MENSVESLLNEIQERVNRLETGRCECLEAKAVSVTSKLPYKVMLYREVLAWRMAELGRESLDSLQKRKLVVTAVLTRAAMETGAALWYLRVKVDAAVKSGAVGDIDGYLMKLLMGTATGDRSVPNPVLPRPIKIGKFLEAVERDVQGFSYQYGVLSEYAHPNWAGTSSLYSKYIPEKRSTLFGQNIRGEGAKKVAAINLSAALMMFEATYSQVGDLMPAFTMLCEQALGEPRPHRKDGGWT